jgi:drug/metabolite transporter (DMT)-like permease
MIALGGAVLAAAVVVVIRQLTRTETSATIFASQCIYALLLSVPLAASNFTSLNVMDVVLLTAAALCASVGQLAMTEGFRFLSVAAGGAFQMTVPVVISRASITLFAESFTTAQAIGGVLVLWGSYHTVVGGFSKKTATA